MSDDEPAARRNDGSAERTEYPTSDERSAAHEEVLHARGHEHVSAAHASTLEVTTDDWLTPAGDCIVGVEADRAPADFDDAFVAACRDPDATIAVTLAVPGRDVPAQRIVGRGDPDLSLESDRSLVCRTSEYVDDRTVVVGADRAAADLDRSVVEALADGARLEVRLRVGRPDVE